jgi:deoxyhypusine synthase
VDPQHRDPAWRAQQRALIYLGYTSNLISAGTREQIRWLVQHRMVDVLVTTAGGVEEDFVKCVGGTTHLGDWHLRGKDLRQQGLNRIGNMLVPNANYCAFEDWIMPVLDAMLDEQEAGDKQWRETGDPSHRVNWTPSKVIRRLGLEVRDPSSVYYWAARNDIPVFCPALTDGSIGDMLYFHSYRRPGLRIDLVEDIRRMNDTAMRASPRRTGMLLLGGGVPKHHINNANLMRNGADFAVMVNTAQEFDGSDSGAKPDEAVSWGKIRPEARPVKVVADATVIFPLLVSQTFARHFETAAREAKPEREGYEARATGDKGAQQAAAAAEAEAEARRAA